MASNNQYDLIIVGGGAAAFAAANRANMLEKKTLMINDSNNLPMGGTCVNVGCIPSKIMLHQGREVYEAQHSHFAAVQVSGQGDFGKALADTREMVGFFQDKNYVRVIGKQEHVEYKEGRATVVDGQTVKVGDDSYSASQILLATGASTRVPSVEGMADIDYLDNVSVFQLKEQPKSVIIIGAGPQGAEFSQIFNRFGTKVTVLQKSERILSKYDSNIAEQLSGGLESEGITIYTKAQATKIRKTADGIEVIAEIEGKGIETIVADKLFLATGLSPNTENLITPGVGVELDENGFVRIDDYQKTAVPTIYAAGDVTGVMPIETIAAKQGSNAVKNMFTNADASIDYSVVPHVVFTTPQVAAVGISEEEYMQKYNTCLCGVVSAEHVESAQLRRDSSAMIKALFDHESKKLIGVQAISPEAAGIVMTGTMAIRAGMTIEDLIDTVFPFPTDFEMLKKAAQQVNGQNLDDMACCVE